MWWYLVQFFIIFYELTILTKQIKDFQVFPKYHVIYYMPRILLTNYIMDDDSSVFIIEWEIS